MASPSSFSAKTPVPSISACCGCLTNPAWSCALDQVVIRECVARVWPSLRRSLLSSHSTNSAPRQPPAHTTMSSYLFFRRGRGTRKRASDSVATVADNSDRANSGAIRHSRASQRQQIARVEVTTRAVFFSSHDASSTTKTKRRVVGRTQQHSCSGVVTQNGLR